MKGTKIDSIKGETIAKWYLRFNGYFIVDNFIIHAGDDEKRISNEKIGNYTEVDILAIRHKFNKEIIGSFTVQNDIKILDPENNAIDFIITEVKTGKQNTPNKVWAEKNMHVIEYILRFAGFIDKEKTISCVAKELAEKGIYHDSENKYSVRLVLISEIEVNQKWIHFTNILFDDIIDFIVQIRGQCWQTENIGIASIHDQWDPLIKNILTIANGPCKDINQKKTNIMSLLQKIN